MRDDPRTAAEETTTDGDAPTDPTQAAPTQGSDGARASKPVAGEAVAGEPTDDLADSASKPAPGLHIVATPIGNAADITLRALNVLRGADVIACEDTRVTQRLLGIHGIRTPLIQYHEHNAERARPQILERIARGQAVALVSDAGTPLISDPGFKLVRDAAERGLPVTALPGPSAALAALVLSGLPSDRFLFAGFLPPKSAARRREIATLATVPATLILYESGRRVPDTLADLAFVLGNREIAVARELTKLYEEVRRGHLNEMVETYEREEPPRGEVVLVVGPPGAEEARADEDDVDRLLTDAMGRSSIRDAAAEVAAITGRARKEVYSRALALRDGVPSKEE